MIIMLTHIISPLYLSFSPVLVIVQLQQTALHIVPHVPVVVGIMVGTVIQLTNLCSLS